MLKVDMNDHQRHEIAEIRHVRDLTIMGGIHAPACNSNDSALWRLRDAGWQPLSADRIIGSFGLN